MLFKPNIAVNIAMRRVDDEYDCRSKSSFSSYRETVKSHFSSSSIAIFSCGLQIQALFVLWQSTSTASTITRMIVEVSAKCHSCKRLAKFNTHLFSALIVVVLTITNSVYGHLVTACRRRRRSLVSHTNFTRTIDWIESADPSSRGLQETKNMLT